MDQSQPQQPGTLPVDGLMSLLHYLGSKAQAPTQGANAILSGTYGQTSAYQAPAAPVDYDPNSIQSYAKAKSDALFGPGHWDALYHLINNESGWNPNAQNPSSSAYGLGQFLDSTWQGVGMQKTSDPNAQVDATLKYIANRYGNPTAALNFWENIAPTQSVGNGSHWY